MAKINKDNLIITSALKMFSQHGFHNTTMSQVAKNVGISVGNIYNYFPSKQNLAKASIIFVTKKLAFELKDINSKDISSKEKITLFVIGYIHFLQVHPEMIDYFFRVYLANREMFCEECDCGFKLAKEFIDEIAILINDGVKSNEFIDNDFYISFSCIVGILGGITFLSGEKILKEDLNVYAKSLSTVICKALS